MTVGFWQFFRHAKNISNIQFPHQYPIERYDTPFQLTLILLYKQEGPSWLVAKQREGFDMQRCGLVMCSSHHGE